MKDCKRVGQEYLDGAKGAPQASHEFQFPASAVWAALLDPVAWTEWLPITKVVWTSPKPLKLGCTRTVESGKVVFEESFFAWDDGKRMAFRFDRASILPISAGVEDYQIFDTSKGCRLDWTGRVTAPFLLGGILSWQFKSALQKGLPKLEKLIASNPARFGLEDAV